MYGENDNLRLNVPAKCSNTARSQGLISTYRIYTWWLSVTSVAAVYLDQVSAQLIVSTQKIVDMENSSVSRIAQHENYILENNIKIFGEIHNEFLRGKKIKLLTANT